MTIALSQGAICKHCKYRAFNINFQGIAGNLDEALWTVFEAHSSTVLVGKISRVIRFIARLNV